MFYVYKIKKRQINDEPEIIQWEFKSFKNAHEKFLLETGLTNGTYKRRFREIIFITTERKIEKFLDEIPIRISEKIPSVFSLNVNKFKYMIVATQKYPENIYMFYSNSKDDLKEASIFLNVKKDKDYLVFKKNLSKFN